MLDEKRFPILSQCENMTAEEQKEFFLSLSPEDQKHATDESEELLSVFTQAFSPLIDIFEKVAEKVADGIEKAITDITRETDSAGWTSDIIDKVNKGEK